MGKAKLSKQEELTKQINKGRLITTGGKQQQGDKMEETTIQKKIVPHQHKQRENVQTERN